MPTEKPSETRILFTAIIGIGLAIAGGVIGGGVGAIPGVVIAAPGTSIILNKLVSWTYDKLKAGVKAVKSWYQKRRDATILRGIERVSAIVVPEDQTQDRHDIHSLTEMNKEFGQRASTEMKKKSHTVKVKKERSGLAAIFKKRKKQGSFVDGVINQEPDKITRRNTIG